MDRAINDIDNRAIILDKKKVGAVDMVAEHAEKNKKNYSSKVDWSNYPENKTPV